MTDFEALAAAMLSAADETAAPEPAVRKRRQPAPCGTHAASRAHYRRGEPLDEACRAARRAYDNARSAAKSTKTLLPCGTDAAARRHRRYGEPVDWACQEASRAAAALRKAASRGQDLTLVGTPAVCGTTAGWAAHLRGSESPCEACRAVMTRGRRAAA